MAYDNSTILLIDLGVQLLLITLFRTGLHLKMTQYMNMPLECNSFVSLGSRVYVFLLSNTLSSFQEKMVSHLFDHLADLCKGVPPNSLKPFIEKSLNLALEVSLAHEGKCNSVV